ncbi:MAG: septum formation initiator family protein [Clostridia bacterium]|nr:septum formation initiator family protein [Clostridia bacterium]
MERTQKQITGRSAVSYSWDNGQYGRARFETRYRDAFRVENVSRTRQADRNRRRKEKLRLFTLEIATVAILVLMLSMVIGKLNHIADIKEEYNIIDKVKNQLRADVNIAETTLAGLINDNAIEYRARTELYMIRPDETSVHVLSNVTRSTPDTIHTAEAGVRP